VAHNLALIIMNNMIEVNESDTILSLVFLEDGQHLLSGEDGMIRQWCADNGTEVGEPIITSGRVRAIALSGDRKWIVSSEGNWATVWDRVGRQRVLTVTEHTALVRTVDVSSDSTRFATGSEDKKSLHLGHPDWKTTFWSIRARTGSASNEILARRESHRHGHFGL